MWCFNLMHFLYNDYPHSKIIHDFITTHIKKQTPQHPGIYNITSVEFTPSTKWVWHLQDMKALSIPKQHRQEAAYIGKASHSALALIFAQERHHCNVTFLHRQVYASSHTPDQIIVFTVTLQTSLCKSHRFYSLLKWQIFNICIKTFSP